MQTTITRKLMKAPLPSALILGVGVLLAGASRPSASPELSLAASQSPLAKEAVGILQQNCVTCHSGASPTGGLRLTSHAEMLKGGASGPAVSLAGPEESLLLKAVRYQGRQMPPSGKLPPAQIDTLARWVKAGAPWPETSAAASSRFTGPPPVTPETMKFWSFQPVRRPPVPVPRHRDWVRNPIDAFVLHRLEAAGLSPAPPASRQVLIRRAYYDLIGLPPSPEEVRAFLADRSSEAWEKVVDRLLASPQYGEKWGRHWLDLVHYAETNSYERDGAKPNAWRYRDYVIQSLSRDKPYDRFVMEQIAGDEMPGRNPEKLIATGFYRLGIWDDEPADREQAWYDDLDDVVRTTGEVFLGLTVGCARCHDHKLDPIPQKDYYRFLAFFAGVNRYGKQAERPIAPEAEQQKQRTEIDAHEVKVKQNEGAIAAIENRVLADLTPVEKDDWKHEEAHERIVRSRVPKLLTQTELDRYLSLQEERKQLAQFEPTAIDTALCVSEDPQPRPMHVLMRGNAHAEGDLVQPGFPSVLNPPAPVVTTTPCGDSCGRRLALARWMTSGRQPLTARVMANRIWQYHFGRGIVRTPSNFGFQGAPPTHPELLDWLASELVRQGWRLKPIHKLILMSSTYQMSSRANPQALARDPENNLMGRFDMRRLEAEEVRDSTLAVNGSLNLKMGGPSIYPTMPKEVLAGQSMPGSGWGKSTPAEQCRRSVYIHVKRSLIYPIIASFDGADTDFSCPVRFATTQPTQALGMMNSAFVNEQAKVFAAYLRKHAGAAPAAQVRLALWRVTQREPSAKEIDRGVRLMTRLEQKYGAKPEEALARFCTVALNLNEFLYLD
jgi:mono/diheme cytochrome c family protein